MAKPYTKTIVGYMRHRKFLALNANAIALWHEGKDYCSEHLTDGLIPTEAVRGFRFRGAKAVDLLKSSCGSKPDGTVYAPLWEVHPVGYKMHDYLEHNDSYEVIQARMERADVDRDWDRRRKQLYRDGPLLALIRARDADQCRYCGVVVNWADRRGSRGATFDHIEPRGDNDASNVVVACRGCNSVKGNRPLADVGMTLRPVPNQTTIQSGSGPKPRNPSLTETETVPPSVKNTDGRTARPLAPIHTSHKNHVVCGKVCLHASQFDSFVRRRNGDDRLVRKWAEGVIDVWTKGVHAEDETGDEFDFWRARYAETWPTSAAAKAAPTAPAPAYVSAKDHPYAAHYDDELKPTGTGGVK
jgi:hypothetical protein